MTFPRILGGLVAVAALVLAPGTAHAQVRHVADPHERSAGDFDIRGVTYDFLPRTLVVSVRVEHLNADALLGSKVAPEASDVLYDVYVMPPGTTGYRRGHNGYVDRYGNEGFDRTTCKHLRSWRSGARDVVRVRVPLRCLGGTYTRRVLARSYSWDFMANHHNVRDRTRLVSLRRG
jgi:hypothetical protein